MADVTTSQKIISLGTLSYNNDKMKEYIQEEIDKIPSSTVDDFLSDTSEHPVQNKVIKEALDSKAEKTDIPTSLPANGGNATTVNNHTVESDVPANAKFTDTVYTHPTSGVTSGTYKSVTVDDKGHVTAGTNPTTLSGYGITDAALKSHTHDDLYYTESEINTKLNTKLDTSLKGVADGLAELDSAGKVPSSQLPSYVDDVLEYTAKAKFPTTGETGKIYVDTTTNKTYRWSGSAYVEISASIALGETSSTAYRGDRGKVAYEHSQTAHAPADAEANVQADWNVTDTTSDAYIKNKPTSLPANGGNADKVGGYSSDLLFKNCSFASDKDCNDLTEPGWYSFNGCSGHAPGSNSTINSGTYFILLNVPMSVAGYFVQIATFVHGAANYLGKTYIRYCNNNVWTDWINIADYGNADTFGGDDKSKFFKWVADKNTDNDCNDCTESGWYFFNGCGGHSPINNGEMGAGGYFFLLTYRYSESFIAQTAKYVHGSSIYLGKTYTRYCNEGVWSDWINIADGGNADTLDGMHASDFTLSYIRGNKPTVTSVVPLDSGVKLTWLPVDGATKYAIASYNGDGKYTNYSTDITGTEYTITGLSNGTEYRFLVQAWVNNKWSSFDTTDHIVIRLPPLATSSANGLMSSTDKSKLDGIASGANAYTHPSYTARTGVPTANQTPAFGGTFTVTQPVSDASGHITAMNSRTITIPSTAASASATGLVSTATQTFAGNKTFNGQVIPAGASAVGTAQARKIYAGTSDMTAGTTTLETGAIYLVYE